MSRTVGSDPIISNPVMTDVPPGGRIFFSSVRRSLEVEDEIRLASVGVDIGSSTSHLAFSRLILERLDNRYVVASRQILFESEVLLTPYAKDTSIDAGALGAFVARQYALAGLEPDAIDTGALILTGVAARRANARAIGELFAAQAGRFVAVSAGDALEATLAAHGSGAIARSIRESLRVLNLDIGGGTSKLAVCERGRVVESTAIDIGARIVAFDASGRVIRIEDAARRFAAEAGVELAVGGVPPVEGVARIVERMADRLFEAASSPLLSESTQALLRLDPLANQRPPDVITFSGGVSEYVHGREMQTFGDLGPALARAILNRVECWGPRIAPPEQGIRATVVGASQYTVQVSGSTIFVEPADTVPLRNVPAIRPLLPLDREVLDAGVIASCRTASAAADGSGRGRTSGRRLLSVRGIGDVRAARCVLPRRRRRPCTGARPRPSNGARRRRRRRWARRHPLSRDAWPPATDRLDRWHRTVGARLRRHRCTAGDFGGRARRGQVAGVSGVERAGAAVTGLGLSLCSV